MKGHGLSMDCYGKIFKSSIVFQWACHEWHPIPTQQNHVTPFFHRKSLVWQSMPLDSYGWPSWTSTWPNCGQPVDQSLGDWSHTPMEASGIHGLMPGSLARLAATQLAQTMGPNLTWAVLATALDGQKVQNWPPRTSWAGWSWACSGPSW